jgi:hypothetical protein
METPNSFLLPICAHVSTSSRLLYKWTIANLTEPELDSRRIKAAQDGQVPLGQMKRSLFRMGVPIFSLAIIALGAENVVCAHDVMFLYPNPPNSRFAAISVLPFLPPVPWLACIFGTILAACGIGLLFRRMVRTASRSLGWILFFCSIVLEVPKYAAVPRSVSLRTVVFEPLAMATLAWLLPGINAIPPLLGRVSRYLLALSLIVFGVDHFLGLQPIGTLLPNWIPWHVFWIAFFGAGFVSAGLSIAFDVLLSWGAAGIGLMFAIWVFTLHLPRVLGLYGIPGAPHSPAEWSSLLIATAMWGGNLALAGVYTDRRSSHSRSRPS